MEGEGRIFCLPFVAFFIFEEEMTSNFLGIEITKRSIQAHRRAMDVISHNIANMNTEGYSRQRVSLETTSPDYPASMTSPKVAGQIGTGVTVAAIERIRDVFLDDRIERERSNMGRWKAESDKLHRIEVIHGEPGENNLRVLFDEFWQSLEDLANDPERTAIRSVVRERGRSLCWGIQRNYNDLYTLREDINGEIRDYISVINNYTEEISSLNSKIATAINRGENPNDYLDRRELLIEKLAEIGNILVERGDLDDFKISMGGQVIVQGDKWVELYTKANPSNNNMYDIYSKETDEKLNILNGKLKGLLVARDTEIPYYLDKLDEIAITFIDKFNEIHRSGYGLDDSTGINFFEPFGTQEDLNVAYKVVGNSSGYVHDSDKPLNDPFSSINVNLDANPSFYDPENPLDPTGAFEINGTIIEYNAAEDTLNDIVERINDADCGVFASISPTHRLVLTATEGYDYKIKSLSDDPERGGFAETTSRREVKEGTEGISLSGDFTSSNFDHRIGGSVTINGTTFYISEYATVRNFMDEVNYNFKEESRSEVVPGGTGIDITQDFDNAGFNIQPDLDGTVTINGYTSRPLGTYTSVQEFMKEVIDSPDANAIINYNSVTDKFIIQSKVGAKDLVLSETGSVGFFTAVNIRPDTKVGIKYDSELDKFTLKSEVEGMDIEISEAQLASSAPVSTSSEGGLNTAASFATAGFETTLSNHYVYINNIEFYIDVNADTVDDFINEVNASAAGVTITYDAAADRFRISSKKPGQPVTVRQTAADGFLAAANFGINDTASHTFYGFFTEAKIPTGSSGGNLLEKLGILKAGSSYDIADIEQSNPLDSLDGSYTRVPNAGAAAKIKLSDDIEESLLKIAAAGGEDYSSPLDGVGDKSKGVGDNSNAKELAALKYKYLFDGGKSILDTFIRNMVARSGIKAEAADREERNRELFMDNLENLRESISGVSLDEEMVYLVRCQQGFQAAARVTGVLNRMMNIIIALGT
jgi:flagellar hook-associated protein FlgK